MNFDQLSYDVEEKYIRNIFDEKEILQNHAWFKDCIIDCLIECHKFYRTHEDNSSVSLRDVQRFIKIVQWFYDHKDTFSLGNQNMVNKPEMFNQCICAFNICYLLRSQNDESRNRLKKFIVKSIKQSISDFTESQFDNIVKATGDVIYEQLEQTGNCHIT